MAYFSFTKVNPGDTIQASDLNQIETKIVDVLNAKSLSIDNIACDRVPYVQMCRFYFPGTAASDRSEWYIRVPATTGGAFEDFGTLMIRGICIRIRGSDPTGTRSVQVLKWNPASGMVGPSIGGPYTLGGATDTAVYHIGPELLIPPYNGVKVVYKDESTSAPGPYFYAGEECEVDLIMSVRLATQEEL